MIITNLTQGSACCFGLLLALACNDSMQPAEAPAATTNAIAKVDQAKEPSLNREDPPVSPSTGPAQAEPPNAAPSNEKAAAGSPIAQCGRICAKSVELHCEHAADCDAMCRQSMDLPACKTEMIAANDCMLTQPISRWECTPDGLAALKEGCEAEQNRFVTCLTTL